MLLRPSRLFSRNVRQTLYRSASTAGLKNAQGWLRQHPAETMYRTAQPAPWRGSPTPLPKVDDSAKASLRADLVEIGDVVEVETSSGTIKFGLVTWSPIGQVFDLVDLNGTVCAAKMQDVKFILKGAFKPRHSETSYSPAAVSRSLKQLVAEAMHKSKQIRPYLRVAYAKLSLDNQMRAVDFEHLCSIIFRSASITRKPQPISCSDRLAVYFATTLFDYNFTRFSGGPLLAVSTQISDSLHKVLQSQTTADFDLFVNALRARTKQIDSPMPTAADPFIDVLKHYMITCDERLAELPHRLLSTLFPNIQSPEWLTSPSMLEKLLRETKLLEGNPFLESGLLTTTEINESGGSRLNFERPESLPLAVPFPQPVYRLADDFGVSIDEDRFSDRKIVSFHVPYVPLSSVFGMRSTTSVQGKSLIVGSLRLQLLDSAITQRFKLRPGEEAICLSISAEITNWNEEWNPSSLQVSLSSCQVESVDLLGFFDVNPTSYLTEPVPFPDADPLESMDAIKKLIERYPNKGLPDFDSTYARSDDVINGLRVLAGEWVASFAQRESIDMIYLYKGQLRDFPAVNKPGTVEKEQIRGAPGEYAALGVESYVPFSFPFDSSISLGVQSILVENFKSRTKAHTDTAAETANRNLLPGAELTQAVFDRLKRYDALKSLCKLSSNDFGYVFLRCTALEEGFSGQVFRAHCREIDAEVAVVANANISQGDTLICTEIQTLDPLKGVLVLHM